MTYIVNADYFIYLTRFPPKVHSLVATNPDGTFSVYLDESKPRFDLVDDYIHEYEHMESDDFYNGNPLAEIEKAASSASR